MIERPDDRPYERTVVPSRAADLAARLEADGPFSHEQGRVNHIVDNYPQVETTEDYLLVTALIDAVDDWEVYEDDLFDATNRVELASTILQGYLDSVIKRQMFQRLSIEHHLARFDIPMTEMEPAMPIAEGDDFQKEEIDWETKTVDSIKWRAGAIVGSLYSHHPSMFDACERLAREMTRHLNDVIDIEVERVDSSIDGIYDGVCAVEGEMFRPDRIILSDQHPLDTYELHDYLQEFQIYTSPLVRYDDFYVVDRDSFGYETVFSEWDVTTTVPMRFDEPGCRFEAMHFSFSARWNWVVTGEGACFRGRFTDSL